MMTIDEYRKKHPDCEYCNHRIPHFSCCLAINKYGLGRLRARTCPCYVPEKWKYNTDAKGEDK